MRTQKRLIAAILVCLFALAPCITKGQKLELGIVQGSSLPYYEINRQMYDGSFPGYAGGFEIRYNFSEHFSILTSPLYERIVHSYDLNTTDAHGNPLGIQIVRFRADYVSLPLMAGLRLGGKIKFQVNAGGYMNYMLNQTIKYIPAKGNSKVYKTGILDEQRIDYGIVAGLGISVPLSAKASLSCELRNYSGLKDMAAIGLAGYINTQVILIGFNYKIGKS